MQHFLFLFLALCSLISTTFSEEANENLKSFTMDLIHRDSIESPFYDPSLTESERITNAALRSISRLNQLFELPEISVTPENGEYLLRYYIGTPPLERLALASTASDLIWVQCSNCKNCFPQETPLYDPTKSSTFTALSCNSQPCNLLSPTQHNCGNEGQCTYSYQYGNGKRFTIGELGAESITFGSEVIFPNTTFGCGLDNNFPSLAGRKLTGVMGLGPGPLSLISQMGDKIGHKFSYCLTSFASSKMKFGPEAIVSGNGVVTTPLIIKPSYPTYYFLNLEGIIIGSKVIKTGQTDGNIIIDSGSLMTFLDPSIYFDFITSLQEALGVKGTENIPPPFNFCIPHDEHRDWPAMSIQFTGANVPLRPRNLFTKIEEIHKLCLTVLPSSTRGTSILGHVAQIDIQLGYDIKGRNVSFARTGEYCARN